MITSGRRVLVVGTTGETIDLIHRRHPLRALFLTDSRERARTAFPAPPPASELVVDFSRPDRIPGLIAEHLARCGILIDGVTCFDDESLSLTSHLAVVLNRRYASARTVALCRDKLGCKRAWLAAGVDCPRAASVTSAEGAVEHLAFLSGPAVLKPHTGGGSEFVFKVDSAEQCLSAARQVLSGIASHPNRRRYGVPAEKEGVTPPALVIEEWIEGPEYSADFAIEDGVVEILRVTKKIPARADSFGTTLAYLLPEEFPPEFPRSALTATLSAGAAALGLDFGICMVDFIVRGGRAFLLEMSPRPGSDCLPALLLRSGGMDILALSMDFAAWGSRVLDEPVAFKPFVGLRLLADRAGTIRSIDTRALSWDPRVLEVQLRCGPGHQVRRPPEDYDSRVLGHVIFCCRERAFVHLESAELAAALQVTFEGDVRKRPARPHPRYARS